MTLRPALFMLVIGLIAVGCSHLPGDVSPGPIRTLPDNPNKPYGVTAINYHFHDTHPSRPLAMDRTIRFVNAGTVKHNVTIPGTGYSKDFDVGETLVIHDIGKLFGGPGRYQFFCRYHVGFHPPMQGTLVITSSGG